MLLLSLIILDSYCRTELRIQNPGILLFCYQEFLLSHTMMDSCCLKKWGIPTVFHSQGFLLSHIVSAPYCHPVRDSYSLTLWGIVAVSHWMDSFSLHSHRTLLSDTIMEFCYLTETHSCCPTKWAIPIVSCTEDSCFLTYWAIIVVSQRGIPVIS